MVGLSDHMPPLSSMPVCLPGIERAESLGLRAAEVIVTASTATSVTATCWEINAWCDSALSGGGAGVTGVRNQAPRPERGKVSSETSSLGVHQEGRCGCLSLPLLFFALFLTYQLE